MIFDYKINLKQIMTFWLILSIPLAFYTKDNPSVYYSENNVLSDEFIDNSSALSEIFPFALDLQSYLKESSGLLSNFAIQYQNTAVHTNSLNLPIFIEIDSDDEEPLNIVNHSMNSIFEFLNSLEAEKFISRSSYRKFDTKDKIKPEPGFHYLPMDDAPHFMKNAVLLPQIEFELLYLNSSMPIKISLKPVWHTAEDSPVYYIPLNHNSPYELIYDSLFLDKDFYDKIRKDDKIRKQAYRSFLQTRLNTFLKLLQNRDYINSFNIYHELLILMDFENKTQVTLKEDLHNHLVYHKHHILKNYPEVLLEVLLHYDDYEYYFQSSFFENHINFSMENLRSLQKGELEMRSNNAVIFIDFYIRQLKENRFEREFFEKTLRQWNHFGRILFSPIYRNFDIDKKIDALHNLFLEKDFKLILVCRDKKLYAWHKISGIPDIIEIESKSLAYAIKSRNIDYIIVY